jgi:hypothetical protein
MTMMLVVAGLFPLGLLGLLLWLGRLEDTLVEDMNRAERAHVPPPVVAVPVRREAARPIPAQRAAVRPRVEARPELATESPEAVA